MNRRHFILAGLSTFAIAPSVYARIAPRTALAQMTVYKSPTCACCSAWVDHVAGAGIEVQANDVDQEDLWALKTRTSITPDLSSCHTAFVDEYVIEGHVPAEDVLRLLAERPDAIGLTVPDMPVGSPGMEMGNRRDTFDTLLVLQDGA